MTTPDSNQNEPGRMKKFTSASVDESIHSRLPRGNEDNVYMEAETVSPPPDAPPPPPVSDTYEPAPGPNRRQWRWKFLPAFWTIASVLSMIVNVVLIIILLLLFQMLNRIQDLQSYATNRTSGLLGGLYTNFVKMDQATISSTIPVDAQIPLNIVVPVQTTTEIQLDQATVIKNAHVFIDTDVLRLNAPATVTLPKDTPLTVRLNFLLNVQNSVPVHLDVPVKIPLNQTELHEPFVGLREVVEPWYCLIEPGAMVNGSQVCVQTIGPGTPQSTPSDPTLLDPALRTPAETVVP